MGNIRRFVDTFVGLVDTPASFAGAANQFARANAVPDAMVFFDLFGTANTWSADQTHTADVITNGGDVRPQADQTDNVGPSQASRFLSVRGRLGTFAGSSNNTGGVGSGGTFSFGQNPTGIMAGNVVAGGGTATLRLGNAGGGTNPFKPACVIGNVFAGNGVASMVNNSGGGSLFGSAYVVSSGSAILQASGFGTFTSAYSYTTSGTHLWSNQGSGSVLFGYSQGTGDVTVTAQAQGTFTAVRPVATGLNNAIVTNNGVGGFISGFVSAALGGNTSMLTANTGGGGFVQGNISNGATLEVAGAGGFAQGSIVGVGTIRASGLGSMAKGRMTTGTILASGDGAVAVGVGPVNNITASGDGSFAIGSADTGPVTAGPANNTTQFGPGVNNTADSLQVGGDGSNQGFRALFSGQYGSPMSATALGAAVTAFAANSNVMEITGDAGANTIATITGGLAGQHLTLIFVDALVTITDDNTQAANSIDLSAAFVSADDTVLHLVYDGTSWYEVSRSSN